MHDDPDMTDMVRCHGCGKLTHIDLLDGKPEPRVDNWLHGIARRIWLWWTGAPCWLWDDPDGNRNWERLECQDCYGPGWSEA